MTKELIKNAGEFIIIMSELPESVKEVITDYGVSLSEKQITVDAAHDDEGARKLAGRFIKAGYKMTTEKPWASATKLWATFEASNGWNFLCMDYRAKTCRIVEKKVWVEPTPAREAIEGHYTTERVLECDGVEVKK